MRRKIRQLHCRICRLAWSHPLPDGNKRTAWASLVIFLDLNGAHWDPDPPDIDDSEATMMAIAAGKVDEAWVADWLRHRVAFSGPPAADVSG